MRKGAGDVSSRHLTDLTAAPPDVRCCCKTGKYARREHFCFDPQRTSGVLARRPAGCERRSPYDELAVITRLGKRSPDAEAPMELVKQPERGVVAHDGRWLEAGTLFACFLGRLQLRRQLL
jgi:hypothetical protein